MRNQEFEIARDLMSGREPERWEPLHTGQTLAPASFREIDGEVLARQYVAHRRFLESEAMARSAGSNDSLPGHIRVPRLQGERREAATPSGSWLSSVARFFWGR